jgi:RNA polymerase primary sigma factor
MGKKAIGDEFFGEPLVKREKSTLDMFVGDINKIPKLTTAEITQWAIHFEDVRMGIRHIKLELREINRKRKPIRKRIIEMKKKMGKRKPSKIFQRNSNKLKALESLYEEKKSKVDELEEYAKKLKKDIGKMNISLILSIAKDFDRSGMPVNDLAQEGYGGVMRAIEKFKQSKKVLFSTYVHWWIKQAIKRSLCQHLREKRLPSHIEELMRNVKKTIAMFMQQDNQMRPTAKQIAEFLEKKETAVQKVLDVMRERMFSLDKAAFNDGEEGKTIVSMIPDRKDTPDVIVSRDNINKKVREILKTLTEREEKVLRMRFGIDFGQDWTLEEVGKDFGVTRERIRQIEEKAIRKLQKRVNQKDLKMQTLNISNL